LEEICGVVPLDNDVIARAAVIWRDLRRAGNPIDDRDLLIGATAIAKELHLWTRNAKHFRRLVDYGLNIWSSPNS